MRNYRSFFYSVSIVAIICSYHVALGADDTASTTQLTLGASTAPLIVDLQQKIKAKNDDIANLEKEIAAYQVEIQKAGSDKKTLQGQLNTLALTRKKLLADTAVTQKKIDATALTIESLTGQIGDKQRSIGNQSLGLEAAIKKTNESDNISLLEMLMSHRSLSDFWENENDLIQLHGSISASIDALNAAKADLTATKETTEKQQRQLQALRSQLIDQKKIVEANQAQTNQLLKDTKNKESNYQKLLAEREATRAAFEKDLLDYEQQIKLIVNPNSYPQPSRVLFPPLDKLVVTQQFGDTEFSRTHSGVYNGHGHSGTDFKASPGTPIKAALAGIVLGVGDTDLVCPGASYGRWVLLKHGNGLTSLYAHLSLIKAYQGQEVETGDLLGYSGTTGYATGPHLHFGLFASQGVSIATLKSRTCRGTYTLPVASLQSYLNPMMYF